MALTVSSSVNDMKGYPDGSFAGNNSWFNIGASPSFEDTPGATAATLRMGTIHRGDMFNGGSWWNPSAEFRDADYWTHFVTWNVVQEERNPISFNRLHTATNAAVEYRRCYIAVQLRSNNQWYIVYDTVVQHAHFRATESSQQYVGGGIEQRTGQWGNPIIRWVNDPTNSNTKYSLHQQASNAAGLYNGSLPKYGSVESGSQGSRIRLYNPNNDSGPIFRNIFTLTEMRLTKWDSGGVDDLNNAWLLNYQGGDFFPNLNSTVEQDQRPAFAYSRARRLTRDFQFFTAWCCNEISSDNRNTADAGVSEAYFRSNLPPIFFESGATPTPAPAPAPTPAPELPGNIAKWYDVLDGNDDPYFTKTTDAGITTFSISPSTNVVLGPSQSQVFTATVAGANITDTTVTWSLSDTTNASINATTGLLTTNANFTGELNNSNNYSTTVIATSNQLTNINATKTITLVPSSAGTRRVKISGIDPQAAGQTGVNVSVFYSHQSNLTGAKITDINGASIDNTLEEGFAVMYLNDSIIDTLPLGTTVKVAAQNQTDTRGFRGVATGVVI